MSIWNNHTIYTMPPAGVPNLLEQTEAQGTFRQLRLAAFSPREKVPAGRMRGKSAWKTKVYQSQTRSIPHRFLSASIFVCCRSSAPWLKPLRISRVQPSDLPVFSMLIDPHPVHFKAHW